jgi:hypothetical protein
MKNLIGLILLLLITSCQKDETLPKDSEIEGCVFLFHKSTNERTTMCATQEDWNRGIWFSEAYILNWKNIHFEKMSCKECEELNKQLESFLLVIKSSVETTLYQFLVLLTAQLNLNIT